MSVLCGSSWFGMRAQQGSAGPRSRWQRWLERRPHTRDCSELETRSPSRERRGARKRAPLTGPVEPEPRSHRDTAGQQGHWALGARWRSPWPGYRPHTG